MLYIVPMVIYCLFCALGPSDYVLTVPLWAIISGRFLYLFYPTCNAARCSLREHWYKYIPKNLPQVSQKQIPIFILLDNFYFNNIAKKSFPGTKLGLVPDLVLRGTWTSPRCSWMSGNNLKSLFIWPLITFVSTTLPKSHSLGLSLVRFQSLQSEAAGPRPDGHRCPETT